MSDGFSLEGLEIGPNSFLALRLDSLEGEFILTK